MQFLLHVEIRKIIDQSCWKQIYPNDRFPLFIDSKSIEGSVSDCGIS